MVKTVQPWGLFACSFLAYNDFFPKKAPGNFLLCLSGLYSNFTLSERYPWPFFSACISLLSTYPFLIHSLFYLFILLVVCVSHGNVSSIKAGLCGCFVHDYIPKAWNKAWHMAGYNAYLLNELSAWYSESFKFYHT